MVGTGTWSALGCHTGIGRHGYGKHWGVHRARAMVGIGHRTQDHRDGRWWALGIAQAIGGIARAIGGIVRHGAAGESMVGRI